MLPERCSREDVVSDLKQVQHGLTGYLAVPYEWF